MCLKTKEEDTKGVKFGGKKYNQYEALQQQRKMERQMRKYRQDIDLLQKGEADAETIEARRIKYQTKYSEYKAFSDRMELPMQRDRIYMDGLKVNFSNKQNSVIINRKEILDVFHLHFNAKGASDDYEKAVRAATTEKKKYFQVTGLHSDGRIFVQKNVDGSTYKKYTPEELAEKIKACKTYNGGPVKIYSCDVGKENADAAQKIADKLGVRVKAPVDKLVLTENHGFRVVKGQIHTRSVEVYGGEKGWKIFYPMGI